MINKAALFQFLNFYGNDVNAYFSVYLLFSLLRLKETIITPCVGLFYLTVYFNKIQPLFVKNNRGNKRSFGSDLKSCPADALPVELLF